MKKIAVFLAVVCFMFTVTSGAFGFDQKNHIAMPLCVSIGLFGGGLEYERVILGNIIDEGKLAVGADVWFNLDQNFSNSGSFALALRTDALARWYIFGERFFVDVVMGPHFIFDPRDGGGLVLTGFILGPGLGWKIQSRAYDFLGLSWGASFDIFMGDYPGFRPRLNFAALFLF
jgi:hypothetical protein